VERYEGLRCEFPASFLKRNVCSQLAAFRYSQKLGGISAIVSSALKREPVPASFAAYGDLVYFGVEHSAGTLGICNGRLSFVLSADEGLSLLNTSEFEIAWKLQCAKSTRLLLP
jgi:hypothetical protein